MRLVAALGLALLAACPECDPVDPPRDAGPPDVAALRVAEGAPSPDESDAPPRIPVEIPASHRDRALALDEVMVAMPAGRSPELLLDVPTGVLAVVLIAQAHEGVHAILERAVGPAGDVLVDDQEPAELSDDERGFARGFPAQFFSDNRVVAAQQTAAFLLPNTPDVPFAAGTYRLRFSTWDVQRQDGLTAKQPVERPLFVGGVVTKGVMETGTKRMDLTFHFTGAGDLTAENATGNTDLESALDVLRDAYGAVGIELGELSVVDVQDTALRTVVLGAGCEGGDLDELLRESAQGGGGVHLFLIERFQCFTSGGLDVGQGIGGMAGGIPGPPWVHGSVRSGVAVATAPFQGDYARLGVVLAHELGHFLGLYHTKENDLFGGPAIYDEISDTPDDDDGAAANLMYFLADDGLALSDGQAAVLRASPWLLDAP